MIAQSKLKGTTRMLFFIQSSLPPKYKSKVEQLYYDYRGVMLHTAIGIVKDYVLAEDIVQVAFERIIKHIEKIDNMPCNDAKGYIIFLVKNLSIDYVRKQKRAKTVPYENIDYSIDDGGVPLEDIAMVNFELSMIEDHLKEMDDKYSMPLILRYTLEFSHAEIAQILNISVENAKVRCHRGKQKLTQAIRQAGHCE